ncbi:DUF262 domain-containing protein [Deltaproteobacteria bacterium OttesenSCG-928-M10]|nr:DUF262 domain-containing protein [Deltaproteobacteria bacterium OttesenSCG-928-M10]
MIEDEEVDLEPRPLMTEPFDPSNIDISNKLMTIDLLVSRLRENPQEIEMDTSTYFQRKAGLWDEVAQSRLIESILIKFPIPAFYFDAENDGKWLVVDGLQRLTSLNNFIVKKTLTLRGLEFLTQLEGTGYDFIGRDLQRVILESQVVAYIINKGTPPQVKYNIFKRINTGGLVLNPQEIRHALHQGVAANFLSKLASLESFTKVVPLKSTDRMEDRSFVNRFLCFYLIPIDEIEFDIETSMDRALYIVESLDDDKLEKCLYDFDKAMKLSYEIFGVYAFRKWHGDETRKNPINKALFDVTSVLFAHLSEGETQKLLANKNFFMTEYFDLMDHASFHDSITVFTTDRHRILSRYSNMHKIIDKTIGESLCFPMFK